LRGADWILSLPDHARGDVDADKAIDVAEAMEMASGATAEIEHVCWARKASTGALESAAELLVSRTRDMTLIVRTVLRGGGVVGLSHPFRYSHFGGCGLGMLVRQLFGDSAPRHLSAATNRYVEK
jgi:hypothetical protein